jgi:hypothetical protein
VIHKSIPPSCAMHVDKTMHINVCFHQITTTNLPKLKLLARGKVRDIYALPDEGDGEKLLFVATDRISAFDIIMENVSGQGLPKSSIY